MQLPGIAIRLAVIVVVVVREKKQRVQGAVWLVRGSWKLEAVRLLAGA